MESKLGYPAAKVCGNAIVVRIRESGVAAILVSGGM